MTKRISHGDLANPRTQTGNDHENPGNQIVSSPILKCRDETQYQTKDTLSGEDGGRIFSFGVEFADGDDHVYSREGYDNGD